MLSRNERIIHSCLNAGFLSAEIAWHQTVFNKVGVVPWQMLMYLAGALWVIGFAALLWRKRALILQQEMTGRTPWYFFLLAVPMCMYAYITPWLLMTALSAIRAPIVPIAM